MSTTSAKRLTVVPEASVAWWLHWCNVAIAAVSFVGVAVHPGWHPPVILVEVVGPLSIVLAVGSGVVFGILHHKTSSGNVAGAYAYVSARAGDLVLAASELAPLVDRYPGLESRLTALENKPPAAAPYPPEVQKVLDALRPLPTASSAATGDAA